MPTSCCARTSIRPPEAERLDKALQRARNELEALIAGTDAMSAEILEFQLALLDDPDARR